MKLQKKRWFPDESVKRKDGQVHSGNDQRYCTTNRSHQGNSGRGTIVIVSTVL